MPNRLWKAVALACGIDLDGVGAAGTLHVVAGDIQRADRVARRKVAAVGDGADDRAGAAQGAGVGHGSRHRAVGVERGAVADRDVAGDATRHRQRAGAHRGRAGVGIGS